MKDNFSEILSKMKEDGVLLHYEISETFPPEKCHLFFDPQFFQSSNGKKIIIMIEDIIGTNTTYMAYWNAEMTEKYLLFKAKYGTVFCSFMTEFYLFETKED